MWAVWGQGRAQRARGPPRPRGGAGPGERETVVTAARLTVCQRSRSGRPRGPTGSHTFLDIGPDRPNFTIDIRTAQE